MAYSTVSEIFKFTDHELIAGFKDLVIEERERLSLQLEYIAELDRRKLFYHYSSLRSFLVEEHGMEEWNAERKIRAARMLKRFPEIKERLQSGKLNLTLLELAMGCAHREKLSASETSEILSSISGLSTRAAMREIASSYPQTSELPKDRIRPITTESGITRKRKQSEHGKEQKKRLKQKNHPRRRDPMRELQPRLKFNPRTRRLRTK